MYSLFPIYSVYSVRIDPLSSSTQSVSSSADVIYIPILALVLYTSLLLMHRWTGFSDYSIEFFVQYLVKLSFQNLRTPLSQSGSQQQKASH